MQTLEKVNSFSPMIELDGNGVAVRHGTILAGHALPRKVSLPKKLIKGEDYGITLDDGVLKAQVFTFELNALGGFHVGLDGKIVRASMWDILFCPACGDPRGMVHVPAVGWVDIYLLNTDPQTHGTSRAGQQIADGLSHVMLPDGKRAPLTWWNAIKVLGAQGKQLLSMTEFVVAMDGVDEGKNAKKDPQKTGHIKGLRSSAGIEQATGTMWTWARDFNPVGGRVGVLGGGWGSGSSGPRLSYDSLPDGGWDYFGARGRCDHLTLG